jgi:hypothetical protein
MAVQPAGYTQATGAVTPLGSELDGQIAYGDSILLTFSEDVDLPTLETACSLTPSVAGTFHHVTANEYVFVPSDSWTMSKQYVLAISTDLKDLAGNPLTSEYRNVFTPNIPVQTVTEIDLDGSLDPAATPYQIIPPFATSPYSVPWDPTATLDDDLSLIITIKFSQPYDEAHQATIANAVQLTGDYPSDVTTPVITSETWLGSNTSFVISFTSLMHSDSATTPTTWRYYRLTIPGGPDQSMNQNGSFLEAPVTIVLRSGAD